MNFPDDRKEGCIADDQHSFHKKLDLLAERVLSSCGLKSKIPSHHFDGDKDRPLLEVLEKMLYINHKGAEESTDMVENAKGGSAAALLTCTDTSQSFQRGSSGVESSPKLPEYWSPPLTNVDVRDGDLPSFEDAAPFPQEFYVAVGEMVVFALASFNHTQNIAQKEIGSNKTTLNANYSLYPNVDAVRIVCILSELIDLNVHGGQQSTHVVTRSKLQQAPSNSNDYGQTDHVSFLDLLLFYAEGNSHVSKVESSNTTNVRMEMDHNKTVPLVNSIFKYFGALPQLESFVHTVIRKLRDSAPVITNDGSSTSLKMAHMKKTEILQDRLEQELHRHTESLETIAGMIYEKADSRLRTKARLQMGNLLHTFVLTEGSGRGGTFGGLHIGQENTGAAGVDSILKIILRILEGFNLRESQCKEKMALPDSYRDLLLRILLPLHKPSGMILWRDQRPMIGLYHRTLVQCIGALATFDKSIIEDVIKYIIHPDIWPMEAKERKKSSSCTRSANTPKLVLLLHEIDTFINFLEVDSDKFSNIAIPLILRLCSCISSDNSRSSERALEFFKNNVFKTLVNNNLPQVMKPLLRALCRVDDDMAVPWNPTVRKMTLLVLTELEKFDKILFEESFREISSVKAGDHRQKSPDAPSIKKPVGQNVLISIHDDSPTAEMVSLNKSMRKWRPPPVKSAKNTLITMPPPMKRDPQKYRIGDQPPLTITGVAPWAIKSSSSAPRRSLEKMKTHRLENKIHDADTQRGSRAQRIPVMASNEGQHKVIESTVIDSSAKIRAYMEKLKPPKSGIDNDSEDGISSWAKAQASESPCLQPSMKFHSLVFGHKLGEGAFSTVKYARLITKDRTRSHWPEYAVKVVSTQKIEKLGYEKSINREIAILRTMCHPSIARLISSFRFRDGAYLILEYCSGGDLHSLIKRNGSLDEDSTRFIVGEIVAALDYIHDLGFVYADLKPENVLMSETGHFKLTDFGGCRPITDEAKNMVKYASRNALKSLRDGDWRTTPSIEGDTKIENNSCDEVGKNDQDDPRIEGTTAYLPPEVILGAIPSKPADSWALGCVLYQCLAGRPPLLDCGGDMLTRQKIVTFELPSADSVNNDFFLENSGTFSFSNSSKNIIKRLLARIPSERPDMRNIAEDEFFGGEDVFSFHKKMPHHLDAGTVAPSPNSQWSRRQFSSIWAPQPQAYVISSSKDTTSKSLYLSASPILDGDEREAFFLSTGNKLLTGIRET